MVAELITLNHCGQNTVVVEYLCVNVHDAYFFLIQLLVVWTDKVDLFCSRALLEAQEIFGLDFDDPNEFARVAEEGLGSEEEEEVEDDDVSSWDTIHFSQCRTCIGWLVSLSLCCVISSYVPQCHQNSAVEPHSK